ncbi:MAG: hypothetical protein LR008_00715 [Candidatus Pacebacteria bacterium]|nr:hypothetical protein [Candidatus Paceibacterota bacterium]
MFFKMLFRTMLYQSLIKPERFNFMQVINHCLYMRYAENYCLCKLRAIDAVRSYLFKIDINFRREEAGKELVLARQSSLEKGIDPMSPDYPDIENVLDAKEAKDAR